MDPKVAEKLVNDVLALKVRTPQTVVECVGVEFAEQFEHLTVMLCEKNLDIDFLKKMFSASVESRARLISRRRLKRSDWTQR
jgi:hypothetical protein